MFGETLPITQPTLPGVDMLIDDLRSVFDRRMVTNADFVRQFEQRVAEHLGVGHAVAVSSCTSGLMLVLRALGCEGEVLMPSFTFYATGHAALWNGLTPVFADCDRQTANVDPQAVASAITSRTCAILAVHVFGNPADTDALQGIADRHHLALVYDAAHGLGARRGGARLGGQGTASSFSLSPTKLITAGEGGLVTTHDGELSRRIRIGRNYGDAGAYDCEFLGLSARMPEFSALLGLRCMEGLDGNVRRRNRLAQVYIGRLSRLPGVSFQEIAAADTTSYKDLSIHIDADAFGVGRDGLCRSLAAENIMTKKYFCPPLHHQRLFQRFYDPRRPLPNTEYLSYRSLSLPLFSHMTEETVHKVCDAVERIHRHAGHIAAIGATP